LKGSRFSDSRTISAILVNDVIRHRERIVKSQQLRPLSRLFANQAVIKNRSNTQNSPHEYQNKSCHQRSRSPAQSVSRNRELVPVSRSHSQQCGELDHGQKLRFQRCRGSVHLHLGLHRGDRFRKDHAGARRHRRGYPHLQAGVATLCRLHCFVHDLYRLDRIRRRPIFRARPHGRVQRFNVDRASDPNPGPCPVAEIEGAQSGCAASLYDIDAVLPAGAVDDDAQARPDGGGVARALFRSARVRLESVVLSGWRLVFQSVLLAAAFCVRCLGRIASRTRHPSVSQVAHRALSGDRLFDLRSRHDDGRALPGFRTHVPGLAVRRLQSERQGKPRAISRAALRRRRACRHAVRLEGLARAEMAGLRPSHQMRRTIAAGVLYRGVSLLHRPFHADDQLGLGHDADFGQRHRHRDHDPGRLLHLLVQGTGRLEDGCPIE
jgi:hypothetical protein